MQNSKQVETFTELYMHALDAKPWLGAFLSGHLMVEFLLRRLIAIYDGKLSALADTLRFPGLVDLNLQIGTIDEEQGATLTALNTMRNRLAHRIGYAPSIAELKALWARAAEAFSDLTDGISQGQEALNGANNEASVDSWVFSELFVQIAYDLHDEYVSRGGDLELL